MARQIQPHNLHAPQLPERFGCLGGRLDPQPGIYEPISFIAPALSSVTITARLLVAV